jgi:hypothetical protein
MPPPALSDLPTPPPGRAGWPWTEGCAPIPARRPDGSAWPRITVATPSFNQAAFLEETLRSVLLQGYPDLEYFVMDGGSTDGSVEIIRKYAPWLTGWRSGPDGGQADAVNRALALGTGAVFNFINSDDVLTPGALAHVAQMFGAAGTLAVAGSVASRGMGRTDVFRHDDLRLASLIRRDRFHQPGIWLSLPHLRDIGGFDASYRYCFDKKLYLRFVDRWPDATAITQAPLAVFRYHGDSKTVTSAVRFLEETVRIHDEIGPGLTTPGGPAAARRMAAHLRRKADRRGFMAEVAAATAAPGAGIGGRLRLLASIFARPRSRLRLGTLRALLGGARTRRG